MARSFFIQNAERPAAIRAQFRKLKDDLRGSGLLLEGPFCDQSGALAQLSSDVNSRMKFGSFGSIVGAAIATLAPQNLPAGERSWLKVPFIVSPILHAGICESAGSVANIKASAVDSSLVRAVDMEGITLVGVAVLRKLGVPSFFSYMHFDQNHPKLQALRSLSYHVGSVPVGGPVPSMLVMAPEPELLTFLPPYIIPLPAHPAVSGFEILDDTAVLSMMQLKAAFEHCIELMEDFSSLALESEESGAFRAMGIGHSLHSGMTLWTLDDAERDKKSALALLNPESGQLGMESVRMQAERTLIHNLLCREHHGMLASTVILSEETRGLFDALLRHMEGPGPQKAGGIVASILRDGHIPRLMAYLRNSEIMREHVHRRRDCPIIKSMN